MSVQIVEKSGEGLSRTYGVTVPAGTLAEKVNAKIAEITPTFKANGFRPGKVPASHIRKLYGKSIMGEVIEQNVSETTQKVMADNQLRPAGQPDVAPTSDMDKVITGDADFSYDITVELIPEFEPVDPATLKLKRPVYEPTGAEIDEALAELATQARTYEPRTGKSFKAKDGDQLTIDFIGRIDGVAFDGGTAKDTDLVLGSGQFIPGFEEQLVGAAPDDVKSVKVRFPDDYQAETLKGKDAEFEVTVKTVKKPVDSKPDDALAERLGMKDLEALREVITKNIGERYANASRFKLKRALLDALDEKHSFPLPPRMVDAEFDAIWQQIEADKAGGGLASDDAGKTDDQLKVEYRKIAERRVRLGLVLAEIGRRQNVAITEAELTEAMRQEAMRYGPQQAQQVFDMYRQRPDLQAQLRAPLYEDKVVDLLFSQAKITDKKVSKDALLEDDDVPEGYGG
ncbi:MAG: trigger factor [Alphaproteobacteria bacterium]